MKRREGLAKVSGIRNHFIVCGWRKELDRVLMGILAVNPEMDPSALVLVNTVDSEKMQGIIGHPALKGVRYVSGDYLEEETLMRANLPQASRVLILADFSQDYSVQEVDSRTVMAVLTIESLSKKIYVSAELLDQRFERYLRLANCDEVILSREYSKLILANASSASGVSNVIEDLLSVDDNKGLKTREIPDVLVGDTFGRLADHFADTYGAIAIGLLENTGNFYKLKREALNEAQMTPDISTLVSNLKGVKQLEPNRSVLNPGREYRVKRNSRAILIERRVAEEGAA
jgi:voltage-gated potassium channel